MVGLSIRAPCDFYHRNCPVSAMASLDASQPGHLVTDDDHSPPDLHLENVPMTLDFHPAAPLVATGQISGEIHVHRYSEEGHTQVFAHAPARPDTCCRMVRFTAPGDALIAGGADNSLMSISADSGAVSWRLDAAHRDAVSALCVLGDTLVASGDESGAVKVWDIRQKNVVGAFDDFQVCACVRVCVCVCVDPRIVPGVHCMSAAHVCSCAAQDYVSDFACDLERHPGTIVASSGDGSLAAYDLRKSTSKGGCLGRSAELEEEILSMQVLRGGKKIACGSSEGVVLIFSWGNWDGATDSFPGDVGSLAPGVHWIDGCGAVRCDVVWCGLLGRSPGVHRCYAEAG